MNVVRPWIPFETVPLCPKPVERNPTPPGGCRIATKAQWLGRAHLSSIALAKEEAQRRRQSGKWRVVIDPAHLPDCEPSHPIRLKRLAHTSCRSTMCIALLSSATLALPGGGTTKRIGPSNQLWVRSDLRRKINRAGQFEITVLGGRSDQDAVFPGQSIPLVSRLIKVSKGSLIQFQRHFLRLAGLQ